MRWIVVVSGLVLGASVACEREGAPPARTQESEVAAATQAFNETAFDTVTWASDSAAIARGRDIFKWACAECHGPEGRGDGGRVIDGDTIRPPSFRREGWRFAEDPVALHRQVFVGNTLGMPHWGLRQMTPRDVVAVERYIRLDLIRGGASPGDTAATGAG